ncbi:MAG: NAD-dependent epimerase/dehydratase family protein [Planctomycetes bacterium]|nr:NAD-dependent epimerase/dehydratase family protein [Planctomycetota bacterium]
MPPTTLITGGAGFIGSHLAQLLASQGQRLLIIDDLSTGRTANLTALPAGSATFIHARLSDALTRQPSLLDGVREVYHLAATVGVGRVIDDPAAMIRNNIHETASLLDACDGRGVTLLLASSSEVYGPSEAMPLSEEAQLLFGPTTSPRWSYGMTKALDEHLALAHHARGGLRAVVARLFNTIGPRQVGQYGMVVPRFVRAAVEGRDIEVHGDGQQTRSFCDVRDVTAAMTALVGGARCHGKVFNVGSDDEITIDELADRVIALAASPSRKRHVPYEQVYGPAFEDPRRRVPDLSRIRRAIGYSPRHTLSDTLTELVALARREKPVAIPNA